jgi:hypothetical protein
VLKSGPPPERMGLRPRGGTKWLTRRSLESIYYRATSASSTTSPYFSSRWPGTGRLSESAWNEASEPTSPVWCEARSRRRQSKPRNKQSHRPPPHSATAARSSTRSRPGTISPAGRALPPRCSGAQVKCGAASTELRAVWREEPLATIRRGRCPSRVVVGVSREVNVGPVAEVRLVERSRNRVAGQLRRGGEL